MTAALNPDVANALVDALCSAADYTAPVAFWVQLHTGNPGVDGTANVATETARQQATFNAASSGSADTSGDLDWLAVAGAEVLSYVSFWDDPTAGNFIGSDSLATARPVVAGDDFTIPASDLVLSLSPIAA